MRWGGLIMAAALGACALGSGGGAAVLSASTLAPADAATNLIAGGPLTLTLSSPRQAAADGADPLVTLTLTRADQRALSFRKADRAPHDLLAQAPGGPLAQAMGFFGDEAPELYYLAAPADVPFMCGPEGPYALGLHRGEGGAVSVVGLRQGFEFETLPDGSQAALPFSPDQICARLKFTESR